MAVLTIYMDYDGYVLWESVSNTHSKIDGAISISVGYLAPGKGGEYHYRGFHRTPLSRLPARRLPTLVRLRYEVFSAGGAAHVLQVWPYNADAQTDPQPDPADVCYARCIGDGTLGGRYGAFTDWRTTGEKWLALGGAGFRDPCQDVYDAKNAVDRFTVGLNESGDNDFRGSAYAIEYAANAIRLEITYPSGGLPENRALIPMGLM